MFNDYAEIKDTVMKIKKEIDTCCDIKRVPCHNDSLCENWVSDGTGKLYLIDWEYSGMNDFMWDLADISIEAVYDEKLDNMLLAKYLMRDITPEDKKHFLASKIYVDFLWTLWAKTRVPFDGQPMEDWAAERYERMKENIRNYKSI